MTPSLSTFSASVNEGIFLKDPSTSSLGLNILTKSIILIDDLGFEQFTFRKLATDIHSTEASIYRYFENKHKLLLYLSSWYWGWSEYKLVLRNANLACPVQKLNNAIHMLAIPEKTVINGLDMGRLFDIICQESSKAYLVTEVDNLNRHGLFYNYKKFVAILSDIVLEIHPGYPYPHMLVTTIIEGIHHQKFFSEHLPSLTDKPADGASLADFYYTLALSVIQKN
jgi:AcrR family transcriptional regulator